MDKLSYRRHRFPSIVIQQAVWLYFRFALSYRDVEDNRGFSVQVTSSLLLVKFDLLAGHLRTVLGRHG